MAGGRVLPTGQRMVIRETSPGQFQWWIYSRDGKQILATGAEPYARFDNAQCGAMAAYRQQRRFAVVDPELPRIQQPKWRDLAQPTEQEKEAAERDRIWNKPRPEGDLY